MQLTDVLPTILARLGLPAPADVQGGVLPRVAHPVVAELQMTPPVSDRGSYRALWEGSWKYVDNSGGATMLYDLAADPRENDDRSREKRPQTDAMRARLRAYLDALERAAPDAPEHAVDPDTVRALEALGYLKK